MSFITLSDLHYISREQLASDFKSNDSALPPNTAIIDVRDSDHIGGHIKGSTWIPSSQLDYKVPELVRELKGKEVVVFHCALSQQRGPSAALRYLREKGRLDPRSSTVSKGELHEEGVGGKAGEKEDEDEGGKGRDDRGQKVYVLKGGFTEWQEKYGQDNNLTEAYSKDIWEFGTQDY
ncbi:Rhodanese-like protein [Clathrospora elynae]|uniref:Rhodanese-like protein n=1 Tax=Clathrospora elynae TaxID=706981 RepID=A0A6A5T1I3_9PLEO|nr:Rhodanese-like protein [Clathrospora elynae]